MQWRRKWKMTVSGRNQTSLSTKWGKHNPDTIIPGFLVIRLWKLYTNTFENVNKFAHFTNICIRWDFKSLNVSVTTGEMWAVVGNLTTKKQWSNQLHETHIQTLKGRSLWSHTSPFKEGRGRVLSRESCITLTFILNKDGLTLQRKSNFTWGDTLKIIVSH